MNINVLILLLSGVFLAVTVFVAVINKPNGFFWNIHRNGRSENKIAKSFYWLFPILVFLVFSWVGGLALLVADLLGQHLIKSKNWTDPRKLAKA